ncbi:hypothetical protein ABE10_02670, partial [Bacillus toyonensis]|nr:hypothetical protein [Bacillus toyonensis]
LTRNTDALSRLRAARELQRDLEVAELEIAREARAEGASWADLAEAAGLNARSAAQRRYGASTVDERKAAASESSRRAAPTAPAMPGLSIAETARRLGITDVTVRARIERGEIAVLETVKRGKREFVRIDPDSLPE